jgi:hypothetical protein
MARKRDSGENQPEPAAPRPLAARPPAGASPHDPPANRQRRYRGDPKPKRTTPATHELESLLTDLEAAKILNVSVKQVRRYRTHRDPRKRLPSIEIGRLRRIEPLDLENFIRVRRRP